MDPITIMMLGATALTAVGKIGAGFMGSDIDKIQKSIADQNTKLLVDKAALEAKGADVAYAEGGLESARTVANLNRTLGGEAAHFAGSNLDPTYGSPLLLQGFSASQGRADLDLIAARARMGAAGALMTSAGTMASAAGSQGQATAFGMKSTQDIIAGFLGAGTTALQGASMWSKFGSTPGSPAAAGGPAVPMNSMGGGIGGV